MNVQTGVILAAGRGTRAYPHTRRIPKAMLDMCGKPLIQYTVELLVEKLFVSHIIVVRNTEGVSIEEFLGDGSHFGIEIEYVVNPDVQRGPAYSLLLTRNRIRGERFVTLLGDEVYVDSNHEDLLSDHCLENDITLTVKSDGRIRDIQKNFGVMIDSDRVMEVVEKPLQWPNRILGCGTYLFASHVFDLLEQHCRSSESNADITSFIQRAIREGRRVGCCRLQGAYINANTVDDIGRARSMIRRRLIGEPKISIIIPVESITASLVDTLCGIRNEFPQVHEILLTAARADHIVVPGTLSWRVRLCEYQTDGGEYDDIEYYGTAYDAGLRSCTGDLAVLMTDDGSFDVEDIAKLLAYSPDCDMVLGTRTTRHMIEQGANMNLFARIGNILLGRTIELLWWPHKVRLTDVGCIFRAIWKTSFELMKDGLQAKDAGYLPEMIMEGLQRKLKIIELPVNYCRRSDESMITLKHRKIGTLFKFLLLILLKRASVFQ